MSTFTGPNQDPDVRKVPGSACIGALGPHRGGKSTKDRQSCQREDSVDSAAGTRLVGAEVFRIARWRNTAGLKMEDSAGIEDVVRIQRSLDGTHHAERDR